MWTFFSDTGVVLNPAGTGVGSGYAGGNKGANPEGVNNPDLESVHMVGPLPRGMYAIGPATDNPVVGAFAMMLIPCGKNTMYGRASFFIHGDNQLLNQSASEGCIVAARYLRALIAASGDTELLVTTKAAQAT